MQPEAARSAAVSVDVLLRRALNHQQEGQTQEAFALLERVLQQFPEHPDALNLMGMLAVENFKQPELAEDLFRKATLSRFADPANSIYFSNLAKALFAQQKYEEAADCFKQAIRIQSGNAQNSYDLAVTLQKLGRIEEAAVYAREALAARPEQAEHHRFLGELLQELGQVEEALQCIDQALSMEPSSAKNHFTLGLALGKQEKFPEAIQAYYKAVSYQKNMPEAYQNLGALLIAEGRFDEAILIYQIKTRLVPDDVGAYCNLGMLLKDRWRLEEAAVATQKTIELKPDYDVAYSNLGSILLEQNRVDEAVAAYLKAIELNPDYDCAYSNLLFGAQYSTQVTPANLYRWAQQFAQQFESPHKPWLPHANSRDAGRRLKIGYVSGDFRDHAAAHFFEPVLTHHDKQQFEIYCYYTFQVQDEVTEHLKAHADHWVACVKLSDDEMAARIREDGIDILVDLSGHTAYNRLLVFARKPAPVQATWIGYAGTTGLTAMDYRLTDTNMDPPGQTERYHSEKLIRLPHSTPYQPTAGCPEVNALPALSQKGFMLASLNAPKKINQQVVNLWARLLQAIPDARLMLGGVSENDVRHNVLGLFERAGVKEDQLILQPRVPMLDYLALHHQIDLALDPFPYNGGTTSMHSLWMGVPVVSLAGENSIARCGAVILARVGLDHFVVHSEEEYFQRVLEFANDRPALAAIRLSLRSRMQSTNNDSGLIVRELESVYRDMWRTWCESGT